MRERCNAYGNYPIGLGQESVAVLRVCPVLITLALCLPACGLLALLRGEETGKPDRLPAFASLSLYSAQSPFNQRIPANPEVDPDSAFLVGGLRDAGAFVLSVKQYSSPVYFADENTPRHDVKLRCGPVWQTGVRQMRSVPIPDWAEPARDTDGAIPPLGCGTYSDQDNHIVILDLTTRCEYDFWQARRGIGGWAASWGNSIQMDSEGVYPQGFSTRGSGFAFLGGVIWPDELATGEILHALAFVYPFTKAGGPVAPATDSDGVTQRPDAIPEGARLQLNPDLDLAALNLTSYERVIARALQAYGMILVDTGGRSSIGLYAIDPRSVSKNPYAGLLPDEDFVPLPNIPLSSFRVLALPPQNTGWQSTLALVPSGCGTLE